MMDARSRSPGPSARPLRVAHVVLQLETGGMERLLVEHARHADRTQVSLHFIALGSRGRVASEIEACGWPVTVIGMRDGVRPAVVWQLARLFRRLRIDVVHTHNTKPLLYAAAGARLAGIDAVVHTRHGQRHGATRRQNVLFGLAARCADRVVCVSDDVASLCRREGIAPSKIATIPNGIDTQRFAFAGPDAEGAGLFVGRLSREKDLPTLLHALARVVRQRPAFRLRIAGAGTLLSELTSLAASLGLGSHVEFLGEVQDVAALLRGASLFVLSSLTEGIPLTVLEAMACGVPVVATRVGGTAEAVAEPATGLLVKPGDPEGLAAAMLQVLGDPDAARRMGEAGRRRVETLFDVRPMVSSYESLYAQIASRSLPLAA